MRLQTDKAVQCLKLLFDGMSIRAVERFLGVSRNTICDLILNVGQRCHLFLSKTLRNIPVGDVQVDEVWSFVGMKERTRLNKKLNEHERGDSYTYTAIERNTKLLVGYLVGKRDQMDTWAFAGILKDATAGRFHLSTDGWKHYSLSMPCEFGDRIDYGQITKTYLNPPRERGRHATAQIVSIGIKGICGNPDNSQICTSHVERSNLTLRMTVRRWTRETNAHSKSWKHHEAAFALFAAFYNFVRPHMSLENETPAMASRLTDHRWTWEELLHATAA